MEDRPAGAGDRAGCKVLPGPHRWDRLGCDPDLDAWLADRDVHETLPQGCGTTPSTQSPGYPSPSTPPHQCGVCGGEQATCIYYEEANGGVSGGWEIWELHCPACHRYTIVEHEWG